MGVITFNGVTSTSVGIQVAHPPMYVYPEKDSEAVHVPGRNGDIIIDKESYKNVPREYEITVYDVDHPEWTYSQRMAKLSKWLHSATGYAKLSDTYDAGYFRKARYVEEAQEFENFVNQGGVGTITFDCRPERFLDSGAETITINKAASGDTIEQIYNPTDEFSTPYIKIYGTTGTGNNSGILTGTLRLNYVRWNDDDSQYAGDIFDSVVITGASLKGGTPYVIVDSELRIVESNSDTPFVYILPEGFPVFIPQEREDHPAKNVLSWVQAGNITKVEVIPRWYII